MDDPAEELRILMLEDTPSDAELEELELRDAGLAFIALRVDTREAFERALDEFKPSIVLADYRLPNYSGREALEYARRTHPQVPVIMVTGALGDEAAVELLKLGAKDYVLKSNMARMAPSIKRALSEERGIRNRKLAERKMHESEIRYRRLFEAARDGILILDAETGQIVDANPFILDLLFYSANECIGKMLWEIGLLGDAEASKKAFKELQTQGRIRYEDLPLETRDGQRRDVEFVSNVYEVDDRKVIQCNIRDITDRLRAAQALRDSEARYKRITEGITDYQYTVRIENGQVVESTQSPACVTVTGYTAEEFAADSYLWIHMVVPEDRELVLERVRDALAGKDVPPIEHRIIRKDGAVRWASDTIILLRDASGKLLSYDGVIRDITERKEAEHAILRERDTAQRYLDIAGVILLALDVNGVVTLINRKGCELLGYAEDEIIGKSWFANFVPEHARGPVMSVLERIVGGQLIESFENPVLTRSGSERIISWNNRMLTDKSGKITGTLSSGEDITERKQAERIIKEEKEFSENLIQCLPDIFYLINHHGRLLEWNTRGAELLGATSEQLSRANVLAFVHEEDRPLIARKMQEAFETGSAEAEARLILKSGVRNYLLTATRIETARGMSVIGIGVDITERKVYEENLHLRSELLNSSADSIMAFDLGGNFVYLNEAAWKTRGYTHDELMCMNMHVLEVSSYDKFIEARMAELAEKGGITFEAAHRCKDGSIMPVEVSSRIVESGGRKLVLSSSRDITERKNAEAALRRANRALQTLSAGNLALVRAATEDELLREAVKVIVETGKHKMAVVDYAMDAPEKAIAPMAWYGGGDGDYWAKHLTWADTELGQLPIAKALRSGTTQVCRDIANDESFKPWRDEALARGYVSNIALPLSGGGKTFGVLSIYSSETAAFDEEEVRLLEELANDLAYGIVTLRTRKEHEQQAMILRQSLEQSIQTIAATLEARDPYTAGHQRRVAELATAIAREMALPFEQVNGIHLAAIVHDLGKIKIPAEILSKPTKLTGIEFALIKTHPQIGYDILKDVKFPWPIADIVLQHHEKMNGSGYPQGLKGGQILLESRIMTVADVVEAMSSHRPYRSALGQEAALSEIERGRGDLYDPAVVDVCINLFAEKGFKFSS